MSLDKTIRKAVTIQMVPFFIFIAVLIYSFGVTLTKADFSIKEFLPLPLAAIVMIGAFYFFYRKKLKPSSYWIKTIDRKPQELVWLKPTNVKHKLWYVATVAESAQFDLYDSGGNEVKIDTSLMKKGLIIREFMDRLPHIHYGYSKEVAKIYRKHPDNFIEELKKRDLYFPIREYEL